MSLVMNLRDVIHNVKYNHSLRKEVLLSIRLRCFVRLSFKDEIKLVIRSLQIV